MLPKKKRISRHDFNTATRGGKTVHGKHVSLRLLNNTNTEKRAAVVVSKKVANNASTRNRLRRRGYAVLGKVFSLPTTPNTVVLYFKKGATELSFSALQKEIFALLGISN